MYVSTQSLHTELQGYEFQNRPLLNVNVNVNDTDIDIYQWVILELCQKTFIGVAVSLRVRIGGAGSRRKCYTVSYAAENSSVFTARCIIVQSVVLRLHVVRLSVPLSVTLVYRDHIGLKSWKLIARPISPTPSLFVAQKPLTYSQGNMGKFGRRLKVEWRKWQHITPLPL